MVSLANCKIYILENIPKYAAKYTVVPWRPLEEIPASGNQFSGWLLEVQTCLLRQVITSLALRTVLCKPAGKQLLITHLCGILCGVST